MVLYDANFITTTSQAIYLKMVGAIDGGDGGGFFSVVNWHDLKQLILMKFYLIWQDWLVLEKELELINSYPLLEGINPQFYCLHSILFSQTHIIYPHISLM